MGKILYIGDPHFGHEKIIALDNRPFKTVEEMNKIQIRNWQNAATDEDTVIVTGDMFWDGMSEHEKAHIMSQLPGKKILIRGNHDNGKFTGWSGIHEAMTIQDGDNEVYLSHYPAIAFPNFYMGAVHLYAHTHIAYEMNLAEHIKQTLEGLYLKPCRMYNTGCMMPWMGYTPRTLAEIEAGYKKFKEMGY